MVVAFSLVRQYDIKRLDVTMSLGVSFYKEKKQSLNVYGIVGYADFQIKGGICG